VRCARRSTARHYGKSRNQRFNIRLRAGAPRRQKEARNTAETHKKDQNKKVKKVEIKGSIFVSARALNAAEKKLGLVASGAKVRVPATLSPSKPLKDKLKASKGAKGTIKADMSWLGAPPPKSTDDLKAFASEVNAIAAHAQVARFHDKAFIHSVWQYLQRSGVLDSMTLEAFKIDLVEAHRAGLVRLTRADLVIAMDPTEVKRSETKYLSAEFHFIS
jgi:hypothetical protein